MKETKTRLPGQAVLISLVIVLKLLSPSAAHAQGNDDAGVKIDKSISNLKIGLLAYIDYSAGESPLPGDQSVYYNTFSATRGYLTVEKSFSPRVGARITLDIVQDKPDKIQIHDTEWDPVSGTTIDRIEQYKVPSDLEGSFVVRVKYLYAVIKPDDLWVFTNMKSEIGLGHMPWLDFEEHVNPYRCQGTMAVERAGVFNSSDLGVSLMGYLGGELDDPAGKTGNKHYAGKYGSWHLGVYNGSGYHGAENNQNKAFEARLSLRPMPELAPGLQLSYFYLTGDGNQKYSFNNDDTWPYYRVQMGMLSFENPALIFTAQYLWTDGDSKGDWVYGKRSRSLPTMGYSGFLDLGIPGTEGKFSVFGRYDFFDIDPDDHVIKDGKTAWVMTVYGVAYDIYKGNMIMFAYENTDYQDDAGAKSKLPVQDNRLGREDKYQIVYQIKL